MLSNDTQSDDLNCLIFQIERAYHLLHELRKREKAAEIKAGFWAASPYLMGGGAILLLCLLRKYIKRNKPKNETQLQNCFTSFLFKVKKLVSPNNKIVNENTRLVNA